MFKMFYVTFLVIFGPTLGNMWLHFILKGEFYIIAINSLFCLFLVLLNKAETVAYLITRWVLCHRNVTEFQGYPY